MKLIIGLGNPGRDYKKTRHNAGFLIVDALKKSSKYKAFKSDKFMNDSGVFVKNLTKLYPLGSNSYYVIHDDLDIKLGEYKIQFGRGPKDHNGVESVERKLGTKDFWRVRVGIENRAQRSEPSGEQYVLQDFTDSETVILEKVIKEIASKLGNI